MGLEGSVRDYIRPDDCQWSHERFANFTEFTYFFKPLQVFKMDFCTMCVVILLLWALIAKARNRKLSIAVDAMPIDYLKLDDNKFRNPLLEAELAYPESSTLADYTGSDVTVDEYPDAGCEKSLIDIPPYVDTNDFSVTGRDILTTSQCPASEFLYLSNLPPLVNMDALLTRLIQLTQHVHKYGMYRSRSHLEDDGILRVYSLLHENWRCPVYPFCTFLQRVCFILKVHDFKVPIGTTI